MEKCEKNIVVRGNGFLVRVILDAVNEYGEPILLGFEDGIEDWRVRLTSVTRSFEVTNKRIGGVGCILCDIPANRVPCGTYGIEVFSRDNRYARSNFVKVVELNSTLGCGCNAVETVDEIVMRAAIVMRSGRPKSHILVGSLLKVFIGMWLPNEHTPDDIDFTITFINGDKSVSFPKEDCIRSEEGKWYVYLSTTGLGAGVYKVQAHYTIPDPLSPSGTVDMYVEGYSNIDIKEA